MATGTVKWRSDDEGFGFIARSSAVALAVASRPLATAGVLRKARGSPNCGKTPLSPNHVIAATRSVSSVSTISP